MCISRSVVRKLPIIVVIAALIPVATILTTYTISKTMGHLPEGTLFPQISLTGNHSPELYVYACGFDITGILMVYLGFVLHIKIIRCFLDEKGSCLNITAMIFLFMAAIGLVAQGSLHLQDGFGEFDKSDSSSSEKAQMEYNAGTFIHLAGAGVFFISALIYAILMDILLKFEDMRENGFHLGWWVAKVVFTVTYVLGAFVSVFGTYGNGHTPEGSMISAIGQWTAVFSFILYIATFAGDIYNVNNERLIMNSDSYTEIGRSFFDDEKPLMDNYDRQ